MSAFLTIALYSFGLSLSVTIIILCWGSKSFFFLLLLLLLHFLKQIIDSFPFKKGIQLWFKSFNLFAISMPPCIQSLFCLKYNLLFFLHRIKILLPLRFQTGGGSIRNSRARITWVPANFCDCDFSGLSVNSCFCEVNFDQKTFFFWITGLFIYLTRLLLK